MLLTGPLRREINPRAVGIFTFICPLFSLLQHYISATSKMGKDKI